MGTNLPYAEPTIDCEAPSSWAALNGHWTFDRAAAVYEGPSERGDPVGLAVTNLSVRAGAIEADVRLSDPKTTTGRIAFGHDVALGHYYSIGVGGDTFAYAAYQFVGHAWMPLRLEGLSSNLIPDRPYHIKVFVHGQDARLRVDDVEIFSVSLPTPLGGDQVGVFAFGPARTGFEGFCALAEKPQAFVVMPFVKRYDAIYKDVIARVCREMSFRPRRADEIHAPGVILEDIMRSLRTSEVVVAEITDRNANVFYELGYAHALGKPTILLADRRRLKKLPFDVSGFRVIFYDNTIAGKRTVEKRLRQHLKSIVKDPTAPP